MLNYCPMDLITELEEALDNSAKQPPSAVRLRLENREIELRLPQLGKDYLLGLAQNRVLVVPIAKVVELISAQLPHSSDQLLSEFLQRQKTPIRVLLSTAGEPCSFWLLNVEGDWLRVAGPKGLSWIPLAAIQLLEIQAVDNSNH